MLKAWFPGWGNREKFGCFPALPSVLFSCEAFSGQLQEVWVGGWIPHRRDLLWVQ